MMSEIVGFLLGDRLGRRRVQRRNEALKADHKTESGVRLLSGEIRGLTSAWLHGVWLVETGRISNGSAVVLVDSIDDAPRRPTGREMWSVDPETEIVTLRSGSSVLEWALMPNCREWAVSVVQDSGREIS